LLGQQNKHNIRFNFTRSEWLEVQLKWCTTRKCREQ